jgi:pimeloyl-ACP methyl ester carboxylesterase
VLLLHGFPTSSFQYRELIPRLADTYRVIAPDLPGFGFTEVPAASNYKYTFDALANTILAFTDPCACGVMHSTSSTTARPRACV